VRVEPYVYFQGRCEEALEFYRDAIGADATVFARFGDIPGSAAAGLGPRSRTPSFASATPLCSPQTAKAQANPTSVAFRCR